MKYLPLAFVLAATTAHAETVLSDVTGNWAAPENNGYFYRAVLTSDGDYLRLRIYEGMAADTLEAEPMFDNPKIAYATGSTPGGKDWLEVGPTGALLLNSVTVNEGYVYSDQLTLSHMDNMIAAMSYWHSNNGPDAAATVPDDPFTCWAEGCYSCAADLWNGTAVAGGDQITAGQGLYEELNASFWTPESIYDLGFCPAPN
ncbi:MAG TPA: hypothetical protein PK450_12345 [Paracoccaceae bacterium]|nr:hypothetical protein [Paracoccaceae bacterium]